MLSKIHVPLSGRNRGDCITQSYRLFMTTLMYISTGCVPAALATTIGIVQLLQYITWTHKLFTG